MITCPICGAQNDPVNRFCDQCGARLDSANAAPEAPAPAQAPPEPTNCPSCGTPALPGQAFCDNCGYDLRTATGEAGADGAVSPDEETVMVSPPAEAPASDGSSPDEETVIVSPPVEATAGDVSPDEETIMVSPPADAATSAAQPDEDTVLAPPDAQPPEAAPDTSGAEPADAAAPPVAPDSETMMAQPADDAATTSPPEQEAAEAPTPAPDTASDPTPDATAPAPDPDPAAPAGDTEERQRLESEIERHNKTIQQMEQMLTSYPPEAPKPEFLTQGLEGARRALVQAQTKLDALDPAPAPDPAEVSRLEQIIKVHSDTVAQFEQMKQGYPSGEVPTFLVDGLTEAQQALEKAQHDLAVLQGEPPRPPLAPAAASVSEAPTPAPTETGTPGRPRLVLFDGKHEFLLPTQKSEIIIGREDPVSHIFPEVDLTSYGGEAGGVSRQHARMNVSQNQWTITDLNSTNHTRVNGNRLEPDTPTPIEDGAQLQFGRIAAVFRLE